MWTVSEILCMAALTGLSFVDILYHRIPIAALVIANILAFVHQATAGAGNIWLTAGGAGVGVCFLIISKVTREKIGYGDSWAILILGIYLGFWRVLETLVGAFFILSAASMICLAGKKMSRRQALPFYPFLAIGYLFCMLAGSGGI